MSVIYVDSESFIKQDQNLEEMAKIQIYKGIEGGISYPLNDATGNGFSFIGSNYNKQLNHFLIVFVAFKASVSI